jgi:hypothetical protein
MCAAVNVSAAGSDSRSRLGRRSAPWHLHLICLAFCYLGIPPSLFKDLVQGMLECVSGELKATGGNYEERFRSARDELAGYSKLRLLGKIFRFLMHGELGPAGIIKVTDAQRTATSASRSSWSGSDEHGKRISSSQPASANSPAVRRTASGSVTAPSAICSASGPRKA